MEALGVRMELVFTSKYVLAGELMSRAKPVFTSELEVIILEIDSIQAYLF